MRLKKLLDLSERQVTNIELLTKYIFGNTVPAKFKAGTYYEAGTYVYTVNETGGVEVYYCINGGTYEVIDNSNWTKGTVPSIVQQSINRTQILQNYQNDYTDDALTGLSTDLSSSFFDKKVFQLSDCEFTSTTVTLPVDDVYHVEVIYRDRKRSTVLNEYTLDGNVITLGGGNTINKNTNIFFEVYVPKNVNSHLIKFNDVKPIYIKFGEVEDGTKPDSVDSSLDNIIVISINDDMVAKSVVFDLLYNGYYISDNFYIQIQTFYKFFNNSTRNRI